MTNGTTFGIIKSIDVELFPHTTLKPASTDVEKKAVVPTVNSSALLIHPTRYGLSTYEIYNHSNS